MSAPIKSSRSKNRPSEAGGKTAGASFWIGAAAIILAVLAVYSPSLNYPFILDDNRFIGDRRVQLPGQVWGYFTNAIWAQFAGGPTSFYRPLFVLWVRVNYILNEMSPWGWHFASVLKHLAVAVLLGLLVWKLLRNRTAVLIAAALFALHPAQTESVAWVSVPDPLMSAAVLGSILFFLKYREYVSPLEPHAQAAVRSDETRTRGKRGARKAQKVVTAATIAAPRTAAPSVAWLAASAALYFAALLVKETAIVTLFILLTLGLPGPAASFPTRVMRALRPMPLFVAATAVYFALRMHALGTRIIVSTQHLPWTTVVLSWPGTLWFYVKVLFWPVRFRAFGNPSRADSFSLDDVLIPALGVCCAAMLLAGGLYWARKKTGVHRALLSGALLLVLPLAPALNLNGLNPDDYLHGRYAYLSSAGLMLLAATGWHLAAKWRMLLLLPAGAVAVAFAALTVLQEPAWKSEMAVFTAGHRTAPRNLFVDRNLVRAHVQEALGWDVSGRCKEALPVFENAIQRYPEDWYGWAGLGDCFYQLDDLPRAEKALRRAADLARQPQVTQRWEEVQKKLANRSGKGN
jgi:protein O-mannosyl-transferase